jgi:hypothetical protein
VNRGAERLARAIDSALSKFASCKGLDMAEAARLVLGRCTTLGGATDSDSKMAQVGRAVIEFAKLACAEESRDEVKRLAAQCSVQTLVIGLCREGGLTEAELEQEEVWFSHSTFVNSKSVMMQLRDGELRKEAVERLALLKSVSRKIGRPRGIFSFSRGNMAPLVSQGVSARFVAVVRAIAANSVVAPAHYVAHVEKSSNLLDVAVRSAMGRDAVVQLRLQAEPAAVFQHHIATAGAGAAVYSEDYFLALLQTSTLLVPCAEGGCVQ